MSHRFLLLGLDGLPPLCATMTNAGIAYGAGSDLICLYYCVYLHVYLNISVQILFVFFRSSA